MVKHSIVVVTPNYPSRISPERGAFVFNLVDAWKRLGSSVNIFNPIPWFTGDSTNFFPCTREYNGHKILTRSFPSFSNKKIGNFNTASMSHKQFSRAAISLQSRTSVPDFYYGKFLMTGGKAVADLSMRFNRPGFVDLGESKLLDGLSSIERKAARKIISRLTGAICVSERLKKEALELGFQEKDIFLAQNMPNKNDFFPLDKRTAREKLGLPKEKFIVAFTGHFIERKGPMRVLAAIQQAGSNFGGVFLGQGPQVPKGVSVLHSGAVEPKEVNLWLNAADVFMLPTLAEGNCNAINEAMMVGLPIITSDIPDTSDQVDSRNGIRVNPYDISALVSALKNLSNDTELKFRMGISSIDKINANPGNERESRILNWISSRI